MNSYIPNNEHFLKESTHQYKLCKEQKLRWESIFLYTCKKIPIQIEYLYLCYLFKFEDCLGHFYFIILIIKF